MANDPFYSGSLSSGTEPGLGSLTGSPAAFSFEPGMVLGGKYRLERAAGFGGMGAVWVAHNESTGAEVAVKILVLSGEGVDDEMIARFRREAHAAAKLHHRGIVRVFDLVELEGDAAPGGTSSAHPAALLMVMELLRGQTLASLIDGKRDQRRFTLEETTAIVLPLLSALAHAHAQGIVHRDLKPENVFLSLDPDGHVTPKILDFGISKLSHPAAPRITTDGATLGTPAYMSPEQARGLPDVDARSDVFAAGILLYEMLAGENPFASASYHSVVAAVLERDPPPIAGAPPEVWRVIKRALEKPVALRYADATELGGALRKATQGVGVLTPADSGGFLPLGQRVSIGDRSVPPAPYREPEATIPSIYVEQRRRARIRGAVVGFAIVGGIVLAAGLYARVGRPTPPAFAEPAAPPPAPLAASAPAATGTESAPAAPAPAIVTIEAPTPAAAAQASAPHARPAVPAPARPAHPAKVAAPSPAPAAAPSAAPAPTKPASVVRDPGF